MQTDTLFQIIDRQAIALLKSVRYEDDGATDKAKQAREQAEHLAVAGDLYVYECVNGMRKPQVQNHLRYHDHGKKDSDLIPKTLMECAGMLAETHARYWGFQGRVQVLRGKLDYIKVVNGPDFLTTKISSMYQSFESLQRECDLCNQRRNELIQIGDEMFRDACNSMEKPKSSEGYTLSKDEYACKVESSVLGDSLTQICSRCGKKLHSNENYHVIYNGAHYCSVECTGVVPDNKVAYFEGV